MSHSYQDSGGEHSPFPQDSSKRATAQKININTIQQLFISIQTRPKSNSIRLRYELHNAVDPVQYEKAQK